MHIFLLSKYEIEQKFKNYLIQLMDEIEEVALKNSLLLSLVQNIVQHNFERNNTYIMRVLPKNDFE